ncbi:hypothetical protein AURDEDRAFT_131770 [Auricularia subglabra TFB-10046 SS5]|uniref:Uncharacterized protein n=1 Tax=Auricularia subglabra (strain TFB-10046 / SS5) TaxID=717982 RepID=J0CSL9_AURST|nr:hypothetical protein AURDEDRAFT_131770 [Auricularia subglabra TFB-10046 SS5]
MTQEKRKRDAPSEAAHAKKPRVGSPGGSGTDADDEDEPADGDHPAGGLSPVGAGDARPNVRGCARLKRGAAFTIRLRTGSVGGRDSSDSSDSGSQSDDRAALTDDYADTTDEDADSTTDEEDEGAHDGPAVSCALTTLRHAHLEATAPTFNGAVWSCAFHNVDCSFTIDVETAYRQARNVIFNWDLWFAYGSLGRNFGDLAWDLQRRANAFFIGHKAFLERKISFDDPEELREGLGWLLDERVVPRPVFDGLRHRLLGLVLLHYAVHYRDRGWHKEAIDMQANAASPTGDLHIRLAWKTLKILYCVRPTVALASAPQARSSPTGRRPEMQQAEVCFGTHHELMRDFTFRTLATDRGFGALSRRHACAATGRVCLAQPRAPVNVLAAPFLCTMPS